MPHRSGVRPFPHFPGSCPALPPVRGRAGGVEVGVFVVVAWAGESVLMVFAKKNYRIEDWSILKYL